MAHTDKFPSTTIEPNGALDPLAASLVEQAAKGDLNAQRRIRQAWFDTLLPGQPQHLNSDLVAASGLFVARLCAANGDHSDAEMLAALLLNAGTCFHGGGRTGLAWELAAEALALYERMSAAGDQAAAHTVDQLVPHLPPEVVERAQFFAKPRGR